MSQTANGELVPLGGGDPIPLIRTYMTVGRRDSCDIRLPFPDVSSQHCELAFDSGYWTIRDLNSTNGIKVNGNRVQKKALRPGDEISIAKKHKYVIEYDLAAGKHAIDELIEEDVMSQGLLEKAGLVRPRRRRSDEDPTEA